MLVPELGWMCLQPLQVFPSLLVVVAQPRHSQASPCQVHVYVDFLALLTAPKGALTKADYILQQQMQVHFWQLCFRRNF